MLYSCSKKKILQNLYEESDQSARDGLGNEANCRQAESETQRWSWSRPVYSEVKAIADGARSGIFPSKGRMVDEQ